MISWKVEDYNVWIHISDDFLSQPLSKMIIKQSPVISGFSLENYWTVFLRAYIEELRDRGILPLVLNGEIEPIINLVPLAKRINENWGVNLPIDVHAKFVERLASVNPEIKVITDDAGKYGCPYYITIRSNTIKEVVK